MRLPNWTHGDLQAGDVRLHYVEMGQGDDLVLLLHGFPESHLTWHELMPELARETRVVALDMRGYGDSEVTRGGYDLVSLSRDVSLAIEALGHARAKLVAHDWGGVVAWMLASLEPQRVSQLAVLNAPHPHRFMRGLCRPSQWRKSWYMFFYLLPWLPELALRSQDFVWLERGMRTAAGHPELLNRELLEKYKANLRRPGRLQATLAYYRSSLLTSSLQVMRHARGPIAAPTLVVWGERDGAMGLHLSQGLERYAPQLERVSIPEAGHWVHEEAPGEVLQALQRFLSAPETAPASEAARSASGETPRLVVPAPSHG